MTIEYQSDVERMAEILNAGDLEIYLETIDAGDEVEKLHVILGRDAKKREYILQIFFVDDIVDAVGIDTEEDEDDSVLLQFFVLLPFTIEDDHLIEAMRAANLINRAMPVAQLGVSEPDRAFVLSYQLVLEGRDISPDVLAKVVGLFGFGIASYGAMLDEVARGATTADAVAETFRSAGLDPNATGDPFRPTEH